MLGKTVVIELDVTWATQAACTNTAEILYGGTTLKAFSAAGSFKIKIQPSSANPDTDVEVFTDSGGGYASDGDVNISGEVPALLKFLLRLNSTGTGGGAPTGSEVSFKINNIWVDDYQTSVLVTNNQTLSPSSDTALSSTKNTGTAEIDQVENSINNGSSYQDPEEENEIGDLISASAQLKIKFTLGFDNTTPSAMTTSIVEGWGAYYG